MSDENLEGQASLPLEGRASSRPEDDHNETSAPSQAPKPNRKRAGAPRAMVPQLPATPPVERQRNKGVYPDCPVCGSAMINNGVRPSNHPFRRMVHWKCQNPECGHTEKQEMRG